MRRTVVLIATLLTLATGADARGRCDGIHGCTCGSSLARKLGYPRNYNGHNLWYAKDWKRAFPHTNAQPGAVVVQNRRGGGHVAQIQQLIDDCHAVVTDNRGQYVRKICGRGATFVMPTQLASFHTFSAKSYRKHHRRDRTNSHGFDWGQFPGH